MNLKHLCGQAVKSQLIWCEISSSGGDFFDEQLGLGHAFYVPKSCREDTFAVLLADVFK